MAINKDKAILEISQRIMEASNNVEKVYHSGRNAEYNAFWSVKQYSGGSPKTYTAEFGGRWSVDTFKPKYDIIPTSCPYLFCGNNMKIDLVEHLENIGIKLDFSRCENQNAAFYMSNFTHIGNASALGGYYNVFQSCKNLVTIDEWGDAQGREMTGNGLTTTFDSCTALENITIKGKFANTVYFHWSTKLTRASIESIINALSENVSGKTLQLSKTAVDEAFKFVSQFDDGTPFEILGSEENNPYWPQLRDSKPNWQITLV